MKTAAHTDLVLVVDDQPGNLAILGDLLEPAGYQLLSATNAADALRVARKARPHVILLDVVMPGTDGITLCRQLHEHEATRDTPVIFITGRAESDMRLAGFEAGGVDYIIKPFEPAEVLARVRTHLELARTRRALADNIAELRAEIARREAAENARQEADERLSILTAREARRWNVAGLVGRSRALATLLREVERLQGFGRTGVLLQGESGTGKELVARALHTGSPRAKAPFIAVNCVAVPGELMESMFFGHVKGAFTGATADRKGYFELAHGGTLFLDEIGDMPAVLQAKLLRVLEDGRITPLGGTVEKQVDVRVVAATNAHLDSKIATGAFRQDLYFRLARCVVRIPPLRERLEDIPLLAAHFLTNLSEEMGLRPPIISSTALDAMSRHRWSGNVRELRNVIESALIASNGHAIQPEHLRLIAASEPAAAPIPDATAGPASVATGAPFPDDLPVNLDAAERALIRRAVTQTGGNIAEAARLLGVHRTRIYRALAEAGA